MKGNENWYVTISQTRDASPAVADSEEGHITGQDSIKRVQCIVKAVFFKKVSEDNISILEGGLTNQNYLVDLGNKKRVIVRLGRVNPAELGIDRVREVCCHTLGAEMGVSPKIHYGNPKEGLLVTDFIEGETLDELALKKGETLEKVVALIKKVHKAPHKMVQRPLSPRKIIFQYWERIQNKKIPYPSKLLEAIRWVQTTHDKYCNPEDMVLCHNDLLSANFIDDGKKIWLIDWEYGSVNDRFCDLGCFAALNNLNQEERARVLKAYFGFVKTEDLDHLNTMSALMSLRDALWALLQIQHGTSTIDYETYFHLYFDRFWEEFEGTATADIR